MNKQYEEGEQFKKKREQFAISIRKNKREQILTSRRRMQQQMNSNQNKSSVIVDESMRTYLQKILSATQPQQASVISLWSIIQKGSIFERHEAIMNFRRKSSKMSDFMWQQIKQQKIIKGLLDLCDQNEYPQLHLQSLWILSNLSSFTKEASQQIFQNGGISIIGRSLANKYDRIVYQAAWASGNIAADSIKYRDQLLAHDAVSKMLIFLEGQRKDQDIVTVIWALTNLARGQPLPKYDTVKYIVPVIAQVLKDGIVKSDQILSDCLWVLSNLSNRSKIKIQRLYSTGVLPTIMPMLLNPNPIVNIPTIRIIGNYTSGGVAETDAVIQNGFFDYMILLLDCGKKLLVKEGCWALSNITAGNTEQSLKFLQRNDLVEKLLKKYPEFSPEVKIQIIWTFTNLEKVDNEHVRLNILKLFQVIKILQMIGDLLSHDNAQILIDVLLCLQRILSFGQRCRQRNQLTNTLQRNQMKTIFLQKGYDVSLEKLQGHQGQKVYEMTAKIIRRFFGQQQKTEQNMEQIEQSNVQNNANMTDD